MYFITCQWLSTTFNRDQGVALSRVSCHTNLHQGEEMKKNLLRSYRCKYVVLMVCATFVC